MKKIWVLIIFLFQVNLYSAVPTIEGLFRNGENANPSGELVVIKAMVRRSTLEELPDGLEENEKPLFLKLIYSIAKEGQTKLLQVLYSDGAMNIKDIIEVKYIPHMERLLISERSIEKSLFYNIIQMLGLNQSLGITNLLKRHNNNILTNREIVNSEKVSLLKKYKKYLTVVKNNKNLKETLESPLKPEKEEDKEKISALMKSSLLREQGLVKLKREGEHFFWSVNLDNIKLKFDNNSHRFKEMSLNTTESEIKINCDEYLLFNGLHMLPKNIFFQVKGRFIYKIQFTALNHISMSGGSKKNMKVRYKDYIKSLNELESRNEVITTRPEFIYYNR